MANTKYALLAQLAEDKQQAAAERMGIAKTALLDAQARLEQLQVFLEEYEGRLLRQSKAGIRALEYLDFRQFIMRLNEAVTTQQGEVQRFTERFILMRQAWQQEYKRLKAFEKLWQREQTVLERKRLKTEQKQLDEFVAQRIWDKQKNTFS